MAFSYSFHLSNKSNAVTDTGKVSSVSRHNLRQYDNSGHYDKDKIEIIRGSDTSILTDVRRIYHDEFDDALEKYNAGKRSDRMISDYLEHVSRSRNDVACEIIIQLGDRDFWNGKTLAEKKLMSDIFRHQLTTLEDLVPEFRIASAIIHYDESSPHMHIVGVPVSSGYKKGLEKQVAKTKVFTAERLSELQSKMRADAERSIALPQNRQLFSGMQLKEKELGRNKDIPKQSLSEYLVLSSQIDRMRSELAVAESLAGEAVQKRLEASLDVYDLSRKIEELKAQEQSLSSQIALKRSELADMERLAGEVEQKRQAVTELDRHISERQEELLGLADISEDEMQLIKSDSIAHNLVQKAIWATCEFLGEQGMLRGDNWRSAAVTANNPVLAKLKEPMTGFLQKVKEHMLKSIKTLAKKKRKGR